jgi:predicted GNAT family acetyltransferase
MEIQQNNQEKGGKFFTEKDGDQLALMTYTWTNGGNMIIEHTEVDPSLKGQGIGRELVAAAVKEARHRGFKIHARCPYAAKVLANTEDFREFLF